jgi:hypothetical protein
MLNSGRRSIVLEGLRIAAGWPAAISTDARSVGISSMFLVCAALPQPGTTRLCILPLLLARSSAMILSFAARRL